MIGGQHQHRRGRRCGGVGEAAIVAAVVVLMVVMCGTVANADEMARLRARQGPGLTSSTLRWVDAEAGQEIPTDALQVYQEDDDGSQEGGVWCRFTDHGNVAGVVRDGVCQAPFMDMIVKSERYEVLVSINASARIVEKEWSKAGWMSPGGVAVDKNRVLAVTHTSDGLILPGYADVKERSILLLNGTEVESFDVAMILTEEEPVEYSMDGITWDEGRVNLKDEDQVLVNLTLENTEEDSRVVSEDVDYTVTESFYFGNVRGTIKGLNATVTGPGGNVWEVTWGVNNDFKQIRDQTISLKIPGKSAVEVSLIGVIHRFSSPYSAKLTAVYKDKATRVRTITAPHEHTYLAELRADFSRPRSLSTGQELTGDFPTSEILIASTTTTSTTTTTTPSPGAATVGDEKAGPLGTPEPSSALPLATLPATLLICLVSLLIAARS